VQHAGTDLFLILLFGNLNSLLILLLQKTLVKNISKNCKVAVPVLVPVFNKIYL